MGRLKVLERAAGLAPGDHGSWAYDDDAGFHRAVTEYFAEGRDRGEQLVYVGDGPEGALADHLRGLGQRERLLDSGQLRLHSVQDIFDGTAPFDPAARAEEFWRQADQAVADGYPGLRLLGDVTALVADPAALPQLLDYEFGVDRLMAGSTATGLCAVDQRRAGNSWARAAAVHGIQHLTSGRSAFAVRLSGETVDLVGEVDIANTADLVALLEAVRRATRGPLRLRLADLDFIDVGGTRALALFEQDMAAHGRPVRFEQLSRAALRTLRLFGLGEAP